MCWYAILLRVFSTNRLRSGIVAITGVCALLSISGIGLCSTSYDRVGSGNEFAKDSNGPTIFLAYNKAGFKKNTISSFMYFVPLISTTLVDRETNTNNEQRVDIISYEKKVSAKFFHVVCEFEIQGKGFHKNTFDAAGRIAANADELQKGEPLTKVLDYIKVEGEGVGRIEVKGTLTGSSPSVAEVAVHFNARGHKSPVTVGLYDIKPKDGQYKYENRSSQTVARVNSLTFQKTEKIPRMGISVASITDKSESDSFFGDVKGAIANLFIPPPKVAMLGNETMLDFGLTLLERKPAFTFPKANNIKESRL